MNKKYLEENIGRAREAIENCPKIDKSNKQLRSKMAAFGAAVLSGGLLSALAYYHENEPTIEKLLAKMYCDKYNEDLFQIIYKDIKLTEDKDGRLVPGNIHRKAEITERILNDSICLKMAFNFFVREQKDENRETDN